MNTVDLLIFPKARRTGMTSVNNLDSTQVLAISSQHLSHSGWCRPIPIQWAMSPFFHPYITPDFFSRCVLGIGPPLHGAQLWSHALANEENISNSVGWHWCVAFVSWCRQSKLSCLYSTADLGFHFNPVYAYEVIRQFPDNVLWLVPKGMQAAFHLINVKVIGDPDGCMTPC